MKTTTVPTVNGPRRVRIIAKRGVWAVTPRLSAPGKRGTVRGHATITHLPTGLAIQHECMTTTDARRLMRALPIDALAHATFDRKKRQVSAYFKADDVRDVVAEFFGVRGWW